MGFPGNATFRDGLRRFAPLLLAVEAHWDNQAQRVRIVWRQTVEVQL